jgi:hypothetical protein
MSSRERLRAAEVEVTVAARRPALRFGRYSPVVVSASIAEGSPSMPAEAPSRTRTATTHSASLCSPVRLADRCLSSANNTGRHNPIHRVMTRSWHRGTAGGDDFH